MLTESQFPKPTAPRWDAVTSTYSRWRQMSEAGVIRASQQGGLFEKCSQNLSRFLLSEKERRPSFDPTLTDVKYFHWILMWSEPWRPKKTWSFLFWTYNELTGNSSKTLDRHLAVDGHADCQMLHLWLSNNSSRGMEWDFFFPAHVVRDRCAAGVFLP